VAAAALAPGLGKQGERQLNRSKPCEFGITDRPVF
jgi:hypothetical protein